MKDPFSKKMKFVAKYGSPEQKEEASKQMHAFIDDAFTNPSTGAAERFSWMDHFANDSETSLKSHQLHMIIDNVGYPGIRHPADRLASWHFGDLKDEHWDKLARHPWPGVTAQSLAHMPPKHVKTAAEQHKDPFVRQLAAGHYKRMIERDNTK